MKKLILFIFLTLSISGLASPDLYLSPSSYNFSTVIQDTTNDQLIIKIENRGIDRATACSAPILSGTDANQFLITFDNCKNFDLAADQSCEIHVASIPTTTGIKQATLERTCTVGGSVSTNVDGIQASSVQKSTIEDSNFEGDHSSWNLVNSSQIAFTNGKVEILEGANRGGIYQRVSSIQGFPGAYYFSFDVSNTSPTDAYAILLGSYEPIASNYFGTKEGVIYTDATGDGIKIQFNGAKGIQSGKLTIDNIRLVKLSTTSLSVSDHDFEGSHSSWSVNDSSLVSFTGGKAILATGSQRGEIKQSLSDVSSFGNKSYYTFKFDADNSSDKSSSSALMLGKYIDIAPNFDGVKKGIALSTGIATQAEISFGSPVQNNTGDSLLLDNISVERVSHPPISLSGVKSIHSGPNSSHTCAIMNSGKIRCWGRNTWGQLGLPIPSTNANVGDDEEPFSVGELDTEFEATSVATGKNHTCALFKNKRVKCWGGNFNGQLGLGLNWSNTRSKSPREIPFVDVGGKVSQIAVGDDFSCALLETGGVRCWGDNSCGQLGLGHRQDVGINESPSSISQISLTDGMETASQIAAGRYHACAMMSNNDLRCWGRGYYGNLGTGRSETIGDDELPSDIDPIQLSTTETPQSIHLGLLHTCILFNNKKSSCFGYNAYGNLGLGNTTNIGVDESADAGGFIDLSADTQSLAAGGNHNCSLSPAGDVRCWGYNTQGQLGLGLSSNKGDDESVDTGILLDLGDSATSMALGQSHSCFLLESKKVICTGSGQYGETGYDTSSDLGTVETAIHNGAVKIKGIAPIARFGFYPLTGNYPLEVTFNASLSKPGHDLGRIVSYIWNFGDGTISTAPNPTHVYRTQGNFNISLTVTNDRGIRSTSRKTISITEYNYIVTSKSSVTIPEGTGGISGNLLSENYLYARIGSPRGLSSSSLISFQSSDESIVRIRDGGYGQKILVGVSEGEATIRATYGEAMGPPVEVTVKALSNRPEVILSSDYFAGHSNVPIPLRIARNETGELLSDHILEKGAVQSFAGGFKSDSFDLNPGVNDIEYQFKNLKTGDTTTDSLSIRYFDGLGRNLSFDDSNDVLTVDYGDDFSFPTKDFTLSFWVRLWRPESKTLINMPSSTGVGWNFYTDAQGHPHFRVESDLGLYDLAGWKPTRNHWTHFAVSFNNSTKTLKFYQNGGLKSETQIKGNLYFPDTTRLGLIGNSLGGSLDELRIFKVEKLETSIREMMFSPAIISDSEGVAKFGFEEEGQVFQDINLNSTRLVRGTTELAEQSDPRSSFASFVASSKLIKASDGGVVSSDIARLSIPKGVLPEDKEISLVISDPNAFAMNTAPRHTGPRVKVFPTNIVLNTDETFPILSIRSDESDATGDLFVLKELSTSSGFDSSSLYPSIGENNSEGSRAIGHFDYYSLTNQRVGETSMVSFTNTDLVPYIFPTSTSGYVSYLVNMDSTTDSARYVLDGTLEEGVSFYRNIGCKSISTGETTSFYASRFPVTFNSLSLGTNVCVFTLRKIKRYGANNDYTKIYSNFSLRIVVDRKNRMTQLAGVE